MSERNADFLAIGLFLLVGPTLIGLGHAWEAGWVMIFGSWLSALGTIKALTYINNEIANKKRYAKRILLSCAPVCFEIAIGLVSYRLTSLV